MRTQLLFLFIFFLAGCSSSQKRDLEKNSRKVKYLKQKIRKDQRLIKHLQEENLVLESLLKKNKKALQLKSIKKSSLINRLEKIDNLNNSYFSKKPLSQEEHLLPSGVVGLKKVDSKNEYYLYGKVIETYRKRDVSDIKRVTDMLLKTYPQSVHADNSIYLSGKLLLEKNQLKKALKYFIQLEKEYPRSNKLVSALFAKAQIYKRLQKNPEAIRVYRHLMRQFPGSLEAHQAKMEVRLINTQKAGI